MQPLTGREIAARVRGMTSAKHQVHGYSVDLTVRGVSVVDATGRVDFGGSEYIPAGRIEMAALRRNPEDKYLWWELTRGSYFLEFNESLELGADELAVLEADDRLLRAGATHTAICLRGKQSPLEMLLDVQVTRVLIKQNARTSRLRVYRFAGGPAADAAGKLARKKK
jgi:hypothetical protein